MKPRLLDLFCGAGGSAMGYHRAGFEVVGVDIASQPNYPFEFVQWDALEYLQMDWLQRPVVFDAIHASPPCQAFTSLRTAWNAKDGHPDLVPATRELLRETGLPYVIENVPGAPLRDPVMICGTGLGLGLHDRGFQLRRHRLFETNFPLLGVPCAHTLPTIGVYGQHGRDRRRTVETFFSVDDGKRAMGIDWMTGDELSQAIPPAYTEHIGSYLLAEINAKAVA